MAIKLYGLPGFICVDRVLTTLYEKDVTDFDFITINVLEHEQKKPEFLEKQPFGVVPVLEMDNLTLFESRAIIRILCDKFEGQGSPLYGPNKESRIMAQVWHEAESQNYNPPISVIVKEKCFKPRFGFPTDDAIVVAEVEKLKKVLDVYETRLARTKYLAGDFFSVADLSHLPYTHQLINVAKMDYLLAERPHVKAWWEDISSRPAWKKVLTLSVLK